MTDEELMQAYRDGDAEAFAALYERHKRRILGFLLTRIQDRDEAEDVFQSVFTKLHRSRHRYRPEIPFLPWIFTLVRNTLIDHVRKKETYARHITTSEEAVASHAASNAGADSIHSAIAGLSGLNENQRRTLELRFNQGLTFAEIAVQMQTSADNARQIASRAIRKLRRQIVGKERRHEKS